MFQLKCQTLGIIQCKDTIPDLQELTVNREAGPNIAWWLPRLLYTGVISIRGQCKLSAYGIWRSLYGVQDIWTITWRRRSLLSQKRGEKKTKKGTARRGTGKTTDTACWVQETIRCLLWCEPRLHLNNAQFLIIATWRVDYLVPESIVLLSHDKFKLSSTEMKSR